MRYEITGIDYDTTDATDLPTTIYVDVDEELSADDKIDIISDKISNITGFCHSGFSADMVVMQ